MSIINNEVPNNKILLKKIKINQNDNKEEIEKFNKSCINNHWFNQKVEIILPIIKTNSNEDEEENNDNNNNKNNSKNSKKKVKGSLLSQASLSGKLIVEGEMTTYFQQQSITPLPSNNVIIKPITTTTTTTSNTTTTPEINTNQLYYQIETTLDLLLSHEFINKYIKNGGFHAISQLNCIDSGNVVAFLPNSTIILNVEKETYQELGLLGKPSVFRNLDRYIITLDTKSKEFQVGSKSYTRLIWALKDRLSTITLICYYQNPNESNQNQNIIFPKGVLSKPLYNQSNQQISKYRLPTFNIINEILNSNSNESGSNDKLKYNEFINEWIEVLGFTSLDLNLDINQDYEIGNSLLSMCQNSIECFKATQYGLISNQFILELIEKTKSLISKGLIEYGCLNIYGFADTPISWQSIEHNYLYGGENDQSLLILPNNQILSSNLIGTYDYYC